MAPDTIWVYNALWVYSFHSKVSCKVFSLQFKVQGKVFKWNISFLPSDCVLFVPQGKLDCFLFSDTVVLVQSSSDRLENFTLVFKYEWHMFFKTVFHNHLNSLIKQIHKPININHSKEKCETM